MSKRPIVLVIEDETPIRSFLRAFFDAREYRIVEAENGAEGLALVAADSPDIIILDLGLPDRDGTEVLAEIRRSSKVPIIVISARDQVSDKVAALDGGADDYLTKPFGADELLDRVRSALRHSAIRDAVHQELVYRCGELMVDLESGAVLRGDAPVALTSVEFRVLSVLVRHRGMVVTHDRLLREASGEGSGDQPYQLRVSVASLRRKIEAQPSRPRYLLSEPGIGYRLADCG